MSVDCASMTLDTTGEAPIETPLKRRLKPWLKPWLKRGLEALGEAPVEARAEARAEARVEARVEEPAETSVNLPQSLGMVGYAAFTLLQPTPLGEIVPFPLVVTAFEAEASRQVLEPASEPEPEPEDAVPDFTAPAPEPAVSYAVGGYRPAPGPQMWDRELPGPATAPHRASHEVEVPVDDSVLPEMAAPGELDRVAPEVTAVPFGGPFSIGGYGADRASADRQARAVLDELSFLFDGS
jgi:hypothetical protein